MRNWAEIWQMYRNCGSGFIAQAVYAPGRMLTYWYLWAATFLYLFATVPAAFGSGAWFWLGVLGMGLSFILIFIAVERAVEMEFSSEYRAHAISSHPIGKRRLYLRYALFLTRLNERYQTDEEVRRILEFASIADKPAPPFRLAEHPVVLPLMTILTVLIADYIRQTETWQAGNGLGFIFLIVMGLFFLVTLLDIARGAKQKQSELKRFLEWAEFDLSENRIELASERREFRGDAERMSG
ncbi:MAG: hypothetical protein JJU03_00190 [Idiomarina sp.]|nr:hypothetical protein [Idiomarina sp.]